MCELKLIKIYGNPGTSHFSIEVQNSRVGSCVLNHIAKTSENFPSYFSSHINYDFDDDYIDREYTKIIVNKLIDASRHLGLNEVLIVAPEFNLPPKEVLDLNNAKFVDALSGHDGVGYIRYSIPL